MKYFLVAGEASGDLHASHLMQALRQQDPEAEFCFFGGSYMQSVGGKMLRHYKTLAYMGFIPVLLQGGHPHLATRCSHPRGLCGVQSQSSPLC